MNPAALPINTAWAKCNSVLMIGLLLKIGVTAVCVAPFDLWPLRGPRVSEAATCTEARPEEGRSLPRVFSLLHQERQTLAAREAALALKEEQLRQIRQEVENRLRELESLQTRLLEAVEEEKKIKGDHQRHLAATLEAMPADKAGKLLEKMDEESAVLLLRRLKGKEAGAILTALAPDKAARLSQRLIK